MGVVIMVVDVHNFHKDVMEKHGEVVDGDGEGDLDDDGPIYVLVMVMTLSS